jgi:hypothetical protein
LIKGITSLDANERDRAACAFLVGASKAGAPRQSFDAAKFLLVLFAELVEFRDYSCAGATPR